MSIINDLDDYKLETAFQKEPECILHTSYKSDRARGIQKVAIVDEWVPQKPELGSGAFGTVRLEKCLSANDGAKRTHRAVKQLRKMHMSRLKVDYRKELIALTKFSRSKFARYQVFVEFLGWFEDEDSVFLAMEYFPLGTLDNFITEKMKERDAKVISSQLLEGLTIMHAEGFTHRDLKPQNIFVVQNQPTWWVKIGDFGITKRVSNNDTALQTATGTTHYLAPEVSHYVDTGNEESGTYTNAVDVWSFACVLYQIMALQVPFPLYPRNLVAFCRGGPFPEPPLSKRTSPEGIDFIRSGLVPLPTLRPRAPDLLQSKWLQIEDSTPEGSPDAIRQLPNNIPDAPTVDDLATKVHDVTLNAAYHLPDGDFVNLSNAKSEVLDDDPNDMTLRASSNAKYTYPFRNEFLQEGMPQQQPPFMATPTYRLYSREEESVGVGLPSPSKPDALRVTGLLVAPDGDAGGSTIPPTLSYTVDQLRQLRDQSFKSGAFSDALTWNDKLVNLLAGQKGAYDQETLMARVQTATLNVWLRDFTSARIAYNQVLADQTRVLGANHPDTTGTMQAIRKLDEIDFYR